MSTRPALAVSEECAVVARLLVVRQPASPANDSEPGLSRDALIRAALRHFAVHGLSAASRAREMAEQSFFAGRRGDYQHWMAICRALDRRMAGAVVARHTARVVGDSS